MSPRVLSGIAVLLGAVGLALQPVSAALSVVVTIVAMVAATGGLMRLNLPLARIAFAAAAAAHAASVWLASGSLLLAVASFWSLLAIVPSETLVRRFGYHAQWSAVAAVPVALLMVALAWPVPARPWVVLPSLVAGALFALMMLNGLRELRRQHRSTWKVKVGSPMPDFTLPGRDGTEFHLSSARGRYVLLSFLRGDWCPVCHVQMRVYQKEAAHLLEHNVMLVVVSPDSGPEAQKFASEIGVEYCLLADPENQVARQIGALHPNSRMGKEDGPLPVSFLVDPAGILRHASEPRNVESFLDPRDVIRELGRMAAPAAA